MKWQYFPSVGIKAPLQQWDMSHYGLVLDLAKMCDARLGEAAAAAAAATTRRLPMALLLVLLLAHQGAAMSLDRLALERNELPQAEQANGDAGDVVVDDMKMAAVPALANGNTDMYMLVPESLASQLDDTEHVHRNTIESESEAEPALAENADMLMLESDDTPAMQLVELPSDITVAESEPEAQTESQLDTQSESEPEIAVASPELIEEHVVEHPVEEEEEEEQAAPAASSQEVQLETITEANEVETQADDELPAAAEAEQMEQATEKQTVEEAQPEVEAQPEAEEVEQQADAEEEQAKPAEEESKADAEPVEQNEVDTTEASLMESMAEGIEDGLSAVMGDLLPEESHDAPVQAELEKSEEQAQEPEQQEEEAAVQPEETQNEIDTQTAAPEIEVETATESALPVQADAVEQPSAEEAEQAQPEQPSAEQAQPEPQAEAESQAEPEQVEKETQNDAEPQPNEVQPSEELIAIPAAEIPKEEAEAEPVVETEKLNEVLSDETPEAVEAQAAPAPEQVEQSQSQEEPQAEAQQEPQAESEQEPQVEAQAAPEIAPQADTPAEPQPESQPEPQSDEFQPESQPEAQPEPQPESQPETQPESQPEPQPEAEAEPQPEAQPETQPEAQPEPQPENQPEAQPEAQPEPQPESQPEPQPESQPEPQAASQPEPQPAESQPEIQADDQSEVPAEPIQAEQQAAPQADTPAPLEPQPEPEKQSILTTIIPVPAHVPVHVEDSVLNYVNASFMQPEQELQKTELEPEATYNAHLRRYDGAQVWRIVVQTDKDKKLADELQSKYDGQLWKEVKQEVDYLLKPQVLAAAERHIRAANLSRIVLIDNLQQVIEVENPPAETILELQNRKGHRLTWQAYHRLQDIHGFIDYMAKTYPDICSTEIIGYSVEKRPLKILKISNGNARNPGIWIDGGMHAREWISPATVTYIANQLAEGWEELPEHMRNINWYIHPVANPDGYEYSHTTDRLWRKNMRAHGRQCPGVDLNRNFGYKWGGKGTSASPCSQTYRGSKAFSEPETFYISKFISGFPRETFQAYLSFHSYGQYILYPWGYDYHLTKDRADLDRVARQAGTIITRSSGVKYTVGSSATTLYPAAGGSDDWAKGIAGIKYAYTVEMGDTGRYGFVLPAQFIESNAKDGYTFADTVARAIIQGKSGRSNTSRRRIH